MSAMGVFQLLQQNLKPRRAATLFCSVLYPPLLGQSRLQRGLSVNIFIEMNMSSIDAKTEATEGLPLTQAAQSVSGGVRI